MKEIKSFKLTSLPSVLPADSLFYVRRTPSSPVEIYITSLTGVPYPIKDLSGIQSVVNTDGTITVISGTNTNIRISSATMALINGALQSGDNISELFNDAGYITASDLPDTKSEFNLQLTDGTFLFVGDITQYTDTDAQNAVVTQTITNGDATHAPSSDVVFDTFATKEPLITPSGNITDFWAGNKTWRDLATDVRNVVLTGFDSAITWARVTTATTIQNAISLIQRQINYLQSTRFISGSGVTINTGDNTKFDIQVVGEIVDPNTFTPTVINVNLTGVSVTHMALQAESYVWINNLGVVVQSLTPPTPIDFDYIVGYWVLVHSNLTNLNIINSFPYYADGTAIKVNQILNFIGFKKFKDSNIVSEGTTGTRITHTGGLAIKAGLGNTTKRPILELNGAVDATFRMRNKLPNTESADTQTVDVNNIDVGGITTPLSNNKFGAHKVWKFSSSLIRIQRGQHEYSNIDSAKTGIKIDSYDNEGNADRNGIHIGWIIFKKGTSWGIGGTGIKGVDYLFVDEIQSASAGTSAVTMQGTYNNSFQPQLEINDIKGAIQNKSARSLASSHIEEWLDSSGNVLHWVDGQGGSSFGGGVTILNTDILSSVLTTKDVDGFVAYINGLGSSFAVAANELQYYTVTDIGIKFLIKPNGRSFGGSEPDITASDVLQFGLDYFDNHFFKDYQVQSRGDAILTVIGAAAYSVTGTAGVITGGTGLYALIQSRTGVLSAATAGSSCGYREGSFQPFNFTLGFKVNFKFANSDPATVADARCFVGCTSTNAQIGNVNPSTLLSMFGIGSDNGEANLSIMHNDGSGTATKIGLGANFPANTSKVDIYSVTWWVFPGTTTLYYSVVRENTGHSASGKITTDINTALQYVPHFFRNNGSTALAVNQTFFSLIAKLPF